jgi:hypothetical protein
MMKPSADVFPGTHAVYACGRLLERNIHQLCSMEMRGLSDRLRACAQEDDRESRRKRAVAELKKWSKKFSGRLSDMVSALVCDRQGGDGEQPERSRCTPCMPPLCLKCGPACNHGSEISL